MKKSEKQKEQKALHDRAMAIKAKLDKGEPTTFQERNLLNVHLKKRKQSPK